MLLHTQSRVGLTGTVKTRRPGWGPRTEQAAQERRKKKKPPHRCIVGIKPDDIPVEARSRLIVNTPRNNGIPVGHQVTFVASRACSLVAVVTTNASFAKLSFSSRGNILHVTFDGQHVTLLSVFPQASH